MDQYKIETIINEVIRKSIREQEERLVSDISNKVKEVLNTKKKLTKKPELKYVEDQPGCNLKFIYYLDSDRYDYDIMKTILTKFREYLEFGDHENNPVSFHKGTNSNLLKSFIKNLKVGELPVYIYVELSWYLVHQITIFTNFGSSCTVSSIKNNSLSTFEREVPYPVLLMLIKGASTISSHFQIGNIKDYSAADFNFPGFVRAVEEYGNII
jgi:hypothetical protein